MNIQQFILSSLKVKIAFLWVFFFRKEKKKVTPHFYMKKYSHYSLLNHSSLSYVHLRVLSSALINKQVTNSTVTGNPSAVIFTKINVITPYCRVKGSIRLAAAFCMARS